MSKLVDLYTEKLDTPDALPEFTITKGGKEHKITVAVNYPLPDQGIHETSLTTLGLSAGSTKNKFELFIEVQGKLTDADIERLVTSIFKQPAAQKAVADGDMVPDAGLALFSDNGINAVLYANRNLMEEDFLDEETGKIKMIELVPLYDYEFESLLQENPADRSSLVLYAEPGYKDSGRGRDGINISQKAVANIWQAIITWHEEHKVLHYDRNLQTLNEGVKAVNLDGLPEDIRKQLPPSFTASFAVLNNEVHVNSYSLFTTGKLAEVYKNMNGLLDAGTFDEYHENVLDSDTIVKKWWHAAWVPFAMNSVGDLLCIDLAPAKKGIKGLVINFLRDQGPVETEYHSFFNWLLSYKNDLHAQRYSVTESALIEEN